MAFLTGLFGFDDEANRDGAQMQRRSKASAPTWIARLNYLLRILFPAYRNMVCTPTYDFLKGRAWLLPATWLYLFYHTLRFKTSPGKHIIDNTFISNEIMEVRQCELK